MKHGINPTVFCSAAMRDRDRAHKAIKQIESSGIRVNCDWTTEHQDKMTQDEKNHAALNRIRAIADSDFFLTLSSTVDSDPMTLVELGVAFGIATPVIGVGIGGPTDYKMLIKPVGSVEEAINFVWQESIPKEPSEREVYVNAVASKLLAKWEDGYKGYVQDTLQGFPTLISAAVAAKMAAACPEAGIARFLMDVY